MDFKEQSCILRLGLRDVTVIFSDTDVRFVRNLHACDHGACGLLPAACWEPGQAALTKVASLAVVF